MNSTSSSTPPGSMPSPAPIDQIDIRGIGGETLAGKWETCAVHLPRHARPRLSNLLMPTGPQSASGFDQFPARDRERRQLVHGPAPIHVGPRLHPRRRHARGRSAGPPMCRDVLDHADAQGEVWFTGYNSNVAGHEEGNVRYFVYNGGTPKYVGASTMSRRRATRGSSSAQGSRANVRAAAASASA